MARSAASSPVVPPPPPPPPPPQLELELESSESHKGKGKKPMDFREILALFHAREPPAPSDAWEALWLATLAEAREAAPKRSAKPAPPQQTQQPQSRGRAPPPPSDAGRSGGPEPPKRPRQSSGADLEPNKLSRVSRAPARPKAGGSKLMQKLGGARGS